MVIRNEILASVMGISVALVVVIIIHKIISEHMKTRSVKRTILSMEVVAFGLLMAAFMLGEVAKVSATTLRERVEANVSFGLEPKDVGLILGSLLASLIIYAVACKLISDTPHSKSRREAARVQKRKE